MGADGPEEVRRSAEQLYGEGQPIWDPDDHWNARKLREIDRFCARHFPNLASENARVLNAGSGSHTYLWMPPEAVFVDKFAAQLNGRQKAVVADIEALPFEDRSFDLVICVGSVLNYVSAIEALAELTRVMAAGARLVLHFETSNSLDHLFTTRWRAPVAPLRTINSGRADTIWIYSHAFVGRTLRHLGLEIERRHAFHICSAALLRLGLPQQIAAYGQKLDWIMRPLRSVADDIILIARKNGQPGV